MEPKERQLVPVAALKGNLALAYMEDSAAPQAPTHLPARCAARIKGGEEAHGASLPHTCDPRAGLLPRLQAGSLSHRRFLEDRCHTHGACLV
jgi:hypothetical protein